MRSLFLIITIGILNYCYSQELIEQECRKNSKSGCIVPKKEIFKYENGVFLVKKYNKNGSPIFIMDSSSSIKGLDGHIRYYSKKGIISLDGYFNNNQIIGTWEIYDKKGTLYRKISCGVNNVKDDSISVETPVNTFELVDIMPEFQGGDLNNFRRYVQLNCIYPSVCSEKGISGMVYINFCIDQLGNVVDVTLVKGVDQILDMEALRIILSSPRWTPGYKNGEPVKVNFTIPIAFMTK